jgi:hypothetical protein
VAAAGIHPRGVEQAKRVSFHRRVTELGSGAVHRVDLGLLAGHVAGLAGFGSAGGAPMGEGVGVERREHFWLFRLRGLPGGSVPRIRIRTKRPGRQGG